MKSLLPTDAYICENWFQTEQEQLLKPLWHFMAPKALLSVNHAFVRRRVAGFDVVVQNFNGTLRAFENICAHRLSPLQTQSHGVNALICSYHAWRYDVEGNASIIPWHDDCYKFSQCEREQLKLKSFQVFEFGQLVFVNLNATCIDFFEQFDSRQVDSLKQASDLFDSEVLVTQFNCRFNWKLVYENLRDFVHPRVVHSKTLHQHVKFDAVTSEDELDLVKNYRENGSTGRIEHLSRLRKFSQGGLDAPLLNRQHFAWQENVQRYGTDDFYLNWLMYPNLHIASADGGYSFIIEHHVPVSASITHLYVYYITGKQKKAYSTSGAVLLSHIQGAAVVLQEDIDILETVQSGLRMGDYRANMGAYESSNLEIERWYMDTLEGRHEI